MDRLAVRVHELQRRVLACPLVVDVDSGPLRSILTHTNTGRVIGILIEPTMIMVCVVARPSDSSMVATLVRAIVTDYLADRPVSVSVRTQRGPLPLGEAACRHVRAARRGVAG